MKITFLRQSARSSYNGSIALISLDNGAKFEFEPGWNKGTKYNAGIISDIRPLNNTAKNMRIKRIIIKAEDMVQTRFFDEGIGFIPYDYPLTDIFVDEQLLRACLYAEFNAKLYYHNFSEITETEVPPLEDFLLVNRHKMPRKRG